MGKVFIVCPECRQRLSFNEIPGYRDMVVECPKCHFKANVSVYMNGSNARGGLGSAESQTQLIASDKSTRMNGQIREIGRAHV